MTDVVESFAFDHRTVTAPFVRLCGTWMVALGVYVTKFDLRFITPNTGAFDTDGQHSLEHLLAAHMRMHLPGVIDLSPMGCRTGFYLTVNGRLEPHTVEAALRQSLLEVTQATSVVAANVEQCGNAADHNLEKAQRYAALALAGLIAASAA